MQIIKWPIKFFYCFCLMYFIIENMLYWCLSEAHFSKIHVTSKKSLSYTFSLFLKYTPSQNDTYWMCNRVTIYRMIFTYTYNYVLLNKHHNSTSSLLLQNLGSNYSQIVMYFDTERAPARHLFIIHTGCSKKNLVYCLKGVPRKDIQKKLEFSFVWIHIFFIK